MDQNAKQQIVEKLLSATNVLVTVSKDPNVDQIAAAMGLELMLSELDLRATVVFSGQIPDVMQFLNPEDSVDSTVDGLRDFIISIDKEKADKLRYKVEDNLVRIFITPYKTALTENDLSFSQGDFNVDVVVALGVSNRNDLDQAIVSHGRILHDATIASITAGAEPAGDLGALNWHDPSASSLSEMLVSMSEALRSGILDKAMSTAFLTGIVSATERFSNDKTTPKVMTMAAQLMAAGADQQLIAKNLRMDRGRTKDLQEDNQANQDKQVVELHGDRNTIERGLQTLQAVSDDDQQQDERKMVVEDTESGKVDRDKADKPKLGAVFNATSSIAQKDTEKAKNISASEEIDEDTSQSSEFTNDENMTAQPPILDRDDNTPDVISDNEVTGLELNRQSEHRLRGESTKPRSPRQSLPSEPKSQTSSAEPPSEAAAELPPSPDAAVEAEMPSSPGEVTPTGSPKEEAQPVESPDQPKPAEEMLHEARSAVTDAINEGEFMSDDSPQPQASVATQSFDDDEVKTVSHDIEIDEQGKMSFLRKPPTSQEGEDLIEEINAADKQNGELHVPGSANVNEQRVAPTVPPPLMPNPKENQPPTVDNNNPPTAPPDVSPADEKPPNPLFNQQ